MTTIQFRHSASRNHALIDRASLGAILRDPTLDQKIHQTHYFANRPIQQVVAALGGSHKGLSALANLLFYDVALVNRRALEAS